VKLIVVYTIVKSKTASWDVKLDNGHYDLESVYIQVQTPSDNEKLYNR